MKVTFKIFCPSMIPNEIDASLTYGVREIVGLCELFKFDDCDQLLKDWAVLLESIIESHDFCIFKNKNTETYTFWSHFLNEMGIKWTEGTQELIHTILVLPIGSAEAERGFSIMNHVKSDRRNRLSPKVLEDIMRVRMNTNDDIEKFAARKYAQQWIKENHLRTDDPTQQHKRVGSDDANKKYLPKLSFL